MQRLGTTTPASRRSTLAPGKGENPARRARCCCPVTAGPPCCAACYLFPRGSSTRQPRFALFFFILSPPFPPPSGFWWGRVPNPPPCYRHPSSAAGCWGSPSPPSSPLLPMVFHWEGGGEVGLGRGWGKQQPYWSPAVFRTSSRAPWPRLSPAPLRPLLSRQRPQTPDPLPNNK